MSRAEEDESEVAEEAGNKSGAAGQEHQTNNQPETERRCQRGICATITIRLAQLPATRDSNEPSQRFNTHREGLHLQVESAY